MERRAGQARPRMYISFVFSLVRLHTFSGDESGGFLGFSLCLSFWFLVCNLLYFLSYTEA